MRVRKIKWKMKPSLRRAIDTEMIIRRLGGRVVVKESLPKDRNWLKNLYYGPEVIWYITYWN